MTFKPARYFTTKPIQGEDSLIGKVTGKSDAVFLRNKYQMELDNANAAVVNQVHYLEDKNKNLKGAYGNAQRLKRDIDAKLEKRKYLYDKLESMLATEKGHEKEMWFETLHARIEEYKGRNISIYQRNRNSDIDGISIGGQSNYPKHYSDSKLQPHYKELVNNIDTIENEVVHIRQQYNSAVSEYNYLLSLFEKDILKCDEKLDSYDMILQEGNEKLKLCGYHSSMFYKMATEKTKSETNLDTLHHRIKQFKNTLGVIKKDLFAYNGRNFVEMEY